MHDLRFACRQLPRGPGFAAVATTRPPDSHVPMAALRVE